MSYRPRALWRLFAAVVASASILLGSAGSETAIAGTKPAAATPAPPPPRSHVPALADRSFFRDLAMVQKVEIYSGDKSPLTPCGASLRKDKPILRCHEGFASYSPEKIRKLLDFLAGLKWVRVKERTRADLNAELGLNFGRGTSAVQLLIDVDHGKTRGDPIGMGQAVLWARHRGAMKASIDHARTSRLQGLVGDLLWVASAPPTAPAPGRSGKEPLQYVRPSCDCGHGESVDYEEAPLPVSSPPPPTPDGSSGGRVLLRVQVDQQGDVCAIRLIRSAEGMTEAAVEGVKHWKFRPATANQMAVCAWVEVSVSFE